MNENIGPRNVKEQRHGYWAQYWENGKLHFKCVYINGKENGVEEYYHYYDGKLTYKLYHL